VQRPNIGYYFERISSISQSQKYFLKVPFNIISPYTHNTNQDFRELYKYLDIVAEIKKYRFEWFGHVVRLDRGRRAKRMLVTKKEGSGRRGRTR
jgi:hypothetical protein